MSDLIRKSIVHPPRQPVPAGRNRLTAFFTGLPAGDFASLSTMLQPIFQRRGYAPSMLLRRSMEHENYIPVTINDSGPFSTIAFTCELFVSSARRAILEREVEQFVAIVAAVSEALSFQPAAKSWFGKRNSSSSAFQKPVMPEFDQDPAQALLLGRAYEQWIVRMPDYQRAVAFRVEELQVTEEEMSDFAEFCGFRDRAASHYWYDEALCATLWHDGSAVVMALPIVPRTPNPEQAAANLRSLSQRLASEFGGRLVYDEPNAVHVMSGWRGVLAQMGLQPGEDEPREFFPFVP
ncbi:hypothetical protein BH09SUM1_BH09SUM1_24990 [soil metagenome]